MPDSQRLLSLDVMRGATIVAMIVVNNPGSWGALYWPLAHADWHGWTPTDLVFPFFLFMVGVAMAFSFAKHTDGGERPTAAVALRISRRVTALLLLGLLYNASGEIFGWLLGYAGDLQFDTLRWPGVLQRIALAYLGASVLILLLNHKGGVAVSAVLLIGYGAALALLPRDAPPAERLGQQKNIVRQVDVALIGPPHMWTQATTRPTDPEGLLSTLPAIVTVMLGYGAGLIVRGGAAPMRMVKLLAIGSLLAILGQAAGAWVQPINKALWTPSFVLLSGGLAMAMFAACVLVFDVLGRGSRGINALGRALEAVGVNAIFAYVASGLVARLMDVLMVGDLTLKGWIYQSLFVGPLSAAGFSSPEFASLAFAVTFVACWWLVLLGMWRLGWTVRV